VPESGKIAGNAKNRPPTTGPNDFAIRPVATVAIPPNNMRRKISYHFVCFSADSLNLTTIYLRRKNQTPKAVASHVERRAAVATRVDGLNLNITHVTKNA